MVLVWVYYSAQLFFLGAEFKKITPNRLGSLKQRRFDEGTRLAL